MWSRINETPTCKLLFYVCQQHATLLLAGDVDKCCGMLLADNIKRIVKSTNMKLGFICPSLFCLLLIPNNYALSVCLLLIPNNYALSV